MVKRNLILYHDGCLDGFVAAMIAHTKAMYDGLSDVRMIPVNYNQLPMAANPGDNLIIVDFSYDPDVIHEYRKKGVNVTIVDHHETQIDKIAIANIGKRGEQVTHSISYTCDCRNHESAFFSKMIVNELDHAHGEYRCFLSDNRNLSGIHQECGASMAYRLAIQDEKFYLFLKTFLVNGSRSEGTHYEINNLINLVRTHDLWLHDGRFDHDATYLAAWFKEWNKKFTEQRRDARQFTSESQELFREQKASFIALPLAEKLAQGKAIVTKMVNEIHELCSHAGRVGFHEDLNVKAPEGTKFGFIPGDFSTKNISMTGSILVKEYGYDVAIMVAAITEDTVTFSMRSDKHGKNVDVGSICSKLAKEGHAIKGGGHRNAAGVTFHKTEVDDLLSARFDWSIK